MLDSETKLRLILENMNPKNSRNVLTAKSTSILTMFTELKNNLIKKSNKK